MGQLTRFIVSEQPPQTSAAPSEFIKPDSPYRRVAPNSRNPILPAKLHSIPRNSQNRIPSANPARRIHKKQTHGFTESDSPGKPSPSNSRGADPPFAESHSPCEAIHPFPTQTRRLYESQMPRAISLGTRLERYPLTPLLLTVGRLLIAHQGTARCAVPWRATLA